MSLAGLDDLFSSLLCYIIQAQPSLSFSPPLAIVWTDSPITVSSNTTPHLKRLKVFTFTFLLWRDEGLPLPQVPRVQAALTTNTGSGEYGCHGNGSLQGKGNKLYALQCSAELIAQQYPAL